MRILARYLLKAAGGPFLFALGVLTGLLMINTVARRIEDLAGKGLPASVILEVFTLSLPHVLALTLPMAVLVAVLHAFSALSADNEITALKASGINLARLSVPLMVAAIGLAGVMLWFNDQLLPDTNHRLKTLLVDVSRKSPTLQLEEQAINPIASGDYRSNYFLQAAEIDPATNELLDVTIWDLSDPGQIRTIYADSGRMAFNQERTDLFLTLYDGHIHDVQDEEPGRFQRVFFERQVIRMRGVGNMLERSTEDSHRGEREMGFAMLADEATERRDELAEIRAEIATLAIAALDRTLDGDPAVPTGAVARDSAEIRDSERIEAEIAAMEAAGAGGQDTVFTADTVARRIAAGPPLRGRPADAPSLRAKGMIDADDQTRFGARVPGGPSTLADRGISDSGEDVASAVTSGELSSLASRARTKQLQINAFEVEYQKKLAIPFACLVFVLIGAPLAVRFPRGGVGMVIAISLGIFAIYYVGLIGGEKLADKGYADPFWAMWTPNIVFLLLGIWGMARIGHESSTSRGGGWDDLWFTLRRFLARPFKRKAARVARPAETGIEG